jgi:hypothetical protein
LKLERRNISGHVQLFLYLCGRKGNSKWLSSVAVHTAKQRVVRDHRFDRPEKKYRKAYYGSGV